MGKTVKGGSPKDTRETLSAGVKVIIRFFPSEYFALDLLIAILNRKLILTAMYMLQIFYKRIGFFYKEIGFLNDSSERIGE